MSFQGELQSVRCAEHAEVSSVQRGAGRQPPPLCGDLPCARKRGLTAARRIDSFKNLITSHSSARLVLCNPPSKRVAWARADRAVRSSYGEQLFCAACAFGVKRASVIACARQPGADKFVYRKREFSGIIFDRGAHRRAQTKPPAQNPCQRRAWRAQTKPSAQMPCQNQLPARAQTSVSSWDCLPSPAGRGAGGEGEMMHRCESYRGNGRRPSPKPSPEGRGLPERTLLD